ncbi:MAG: histidinol-phosphatase [Halobacteriovoraceae bacterium]|nr:histidinol-phosphatase [Halobacteriovoraceae bacterium]|tara:strand:- start:832 stop:1338 length:507 start_codon:yes stop_codon:yes gene_type:complete
MGQFSSNNLKKFAILDRDGTLIEETNDERIDSLEKLKLLPNMVSSLRQLKELGFTLVMATNQYDLGTKKFPVAKFEKPQNHLLSTLEKEGITFEEIFICPHGKYSKCNCKKPKLGMLPHNFIKKIDQSSSIMVGDRRSDQIFAKRLGIKGIKISKKNGWKEIINKLTK